MIFYEDIIIINYIFIPLILLYGVDRGARDRRLLRRMLLFEVSSSAMKTENSANVDEEVRFDV